MYVVIKREKLKAFIDAMYNVRVYTEVINFDEEDKKYTVRVDSENLREAFYIGRWVGRNCSTDEIIIIEYNAIGPKVG